MAGAARSLAAAALAALVPLAAQALPLHQIRLPPGFQLALYAESVPGARSLARGPQGIVFVGTRDTGKVYALRDADGDGRAEEMHTVASDLLLPNGVAWRDSALYVAEIHRVLRFDGLAARLDDPPDPVVVRDDLPRDRHHGWKFIAFGPDGRLYVPVGAPCNVCRSDDERHASILRMRPDGRELEVFAHGVRNTVGFDWHPQTGELWFTDNGRDWLGENRPPDELNHAPRAGLHFGFPFCHGRAFPDPEFGGEAKCDSFVAPVQELGAHVAALGMRFYRGAMFPPAYRGQIFIAEHGSWNRREPSGYRVTRVRLDGERAVEYATFAQGWLQGERPWGRPVDLLELPDGSLLVSDDHAGAVYRITYHEPAGGAR